MRTRTAVALALLLSGAGLAAAPPPAEARTTFLVKRFLLGRLEPGTQRFVAHGGPGTTNVPRDSVILFVFSKPLDLESLDLRTVRIGIPSKPGLQFPAEGDFYPYRERRLDEVSGEFVESRRRFRNRVLFDPVKSQSPAQQQNRLGFEADATYSVRLEGVDRGSLRTVMSRGGIALEVSFETTFRTTAERHSDW
jgi:hypothetical protein